jgi:hypothetical protein
MKTGGSMRNNGMTMGDHFIYTPSTTDVTIRWRAAHGWVPPTEDPAYQKKWAEFRLKCAQGIETIVNPDSMAASTLASHTA